MAGEITITFQEGPLVVDFHSITVTGPAGKDGRDGRDGKDGPPGPPGTDADGATDPGDLTLLFDNKLF